VVFAVIAWAACGVLGYLIASGKGRGDEGAALGFLLGPIGVVCSALLGDKRTRCQFCREPVTPGATTCPHCREAIRPASDVRTRCRFCRESVALDATVCPHCQKEITPACNVVCSNCGNGFNLSPAALGHIVRCPHCRKMTPTKKAAAPTADPSRKFSPAFGDDRVDKVTPFR